jgi:hypothetical protein
VRDTTMVVERIALLDQELVDQIGEAIDRYVSSMGMLSASITVSVKNGKVDKIKLRKDLGGIQWSGQ